MSEMQVELEPKSQPVVAAPAVEPPAPPRIEAPPTPPKGRRQPATSSGFPWERSPLAKFSMDQLLEEVDRRRTLAARLERERDRILEEMATIEAELAAMGIAVGGAQPGVQRAPATTRQPRARNSVTLADAIAMAVEPGATVTPAEAMTLVLSNGFVTNSKTFNVQVTNALSKDRRFRRVGRGQYERIAA
jgi:hypothetical protein